MGAKSKNVQKSGQKKSHHNGFIFCKFFEGAKKGSKRQKMSKKSCAQSCNFCHGADFMLSFFSALKSF